MRRAPGRGGPVLAGLVAVLVAVLCLLPRHALAVPDAGIDDTEGSGGQLSALAECRRETRVLPEGRTGRKTSSSTLYTNEKVRILNRCMAARGYSYGSLLDNPFDGTAAGNLPDSPASPPEGQIVHPPAGTVAGPAVKTDGGKAVQDSPPAARPSPPVPQEDKNASQAEPSRGIPLFVPREGGAAPGPVFLP